MRNLLLLGPLQRKMSKATMLRQFDRGGIVIVTDSATQPAPGFVAGSPFGCLFLNEMTDPLEFLVLEADAAAADEAMNDRERRELLIAQRGGCALGLFAAETEGIIAWKVPAPLPGAMPAVLGLVCVRGRMFTVIDPRSFANADRLGHNATAGFVVLLAGDEQLGLAVEKVTSITEIFVDEIEPTGDGDDRSLIRGRWSDPTGTVTILDPARIFAAVCGEPETSERSI